MSELASIAEAFSKYGAWMFVAVLLVVVKTLYNRLNTIQDARLSDMRDFLTTGIRAQEASAHALEQLEIVVRSIKP